MTAVYSTQFVAHAQFGAGSGVGYTVPAGFVAVVRSVQLAEFSGTASGCVLEDASGVQMANAQSGTSGFFQNSSLRAVLNAGDEIKYSVSGGDWTIRVSGYLLST